jgi:2-oxoglutarate ferredoxin oxidoreductase subunit gamma
MPHNERDYFEIIISGVGGQGNVSSGIILGEAASCYENKFATMTCTYGTEARGTFAKSDVLIGKGFIDFYECQNPDVIMVLHNKAYPKIKNRIFKETILVINNNEVDQIDENMGRIFSFPLSDLAFEIGSLQTVNIIALAFIVGKTKFIKKSSLVNVVKNKYSNSKIKKLNMAALECGFQLLT